MNAKICDHDDDDADAIGGSSNHYSPASFQSVNALVLVVPIMSVPRVCLYLSWFRLQSKCLQLYNLLTAKWPIGSFSLVYISRYSSHFSALSLQNQSPPPLSYDDHRLIYFNLRFQDTASVHSVGGSSQQSCSAGSNILGLLSNPLK